MPNRPFAEETDGSSFDVRFGWCGGFAFSTYRSTERGGEAVAMARLPDAKLGWALWVFLERLEPLRFQLSNRDGT